MSLHYQDDWLTVHHGDCKTVMAGMEPESVHCVVTSPPYWGLRDYGSPGQLGLERTPEEYVANMVAVFREVRRVLRADGTVWLNLGDSYAQGGSGGSGGYGPASTLSGYTSENTKHRVAYDTAFTRKAPPGLKPKDLVGIPWRVAFALQADGWYLRSDIIWSKPNPMPESVTDRPTKSHEYLFLLSKSPRYYFDADAVREAGTMHPADWNDDGTQKRSSHVRGDFIGKNVLPGKEAFRTITANRNIRSVWTIATAPYPGAHFATFPPKLVEPCIKAGTSEKGVCPECGAPWEREVEREGGERYATGKSAAKNSAGLATAFSGYTDGSSAPTFITTGWRPPNCKHRDSYTGLHAEPVGATVLDPFAGSGTTGMVAQSLSRRAVLIDLSLDYLGQLMDRNADIPLGLGA